MRLRKVTFELVGMMDVLHSWIDIICTCTIIIACNMNSRLNNHSTAHQCRDFASSAAITSFVTFTGSSSNFFPVQY